MLQMVQDLMKDSACGHGLSEDSAVTPPTLSPTQGL